MRIAKLGLGFAALAIAMPAQAVGLGDLAKVVLGGGSILKTAEAKCGTSAKLTKTDQLALTFARAAAEQALPLSEFVALDRATVDEAEAAAQSSTFCPETKKKKAGLMAKVKKAGKALIKARMLG
jgi:hypothetical protein